MYTVQTQKLFRQEYVQAFRTVSFTHTHTKFRLLVFTSSYVVSAYHHAFGETVQVRHPSLWTYIWHLKNQQARAEQQMTAAANGEAPPTRRRKWRQLEQRIVRLKNQYINGNRNLEEYWSAVAHCICHFQ